jgi:hypothetical protein
MTTIDFGDKNNTTVCLNVSSDIIIFGNGQADKLLLNGDSKSELPTGEYYKPLI